MNENSPIECDPRFCSGSPRVSGTRITVHNVVTKFDAERSLSVTCEEYAISEKQVVAALKYCSSLSCVSDKSRGEFCATCVLRNVKGGAATGLAAFKNSKSISELAAIIPAENLSHPETFGWITASELLLGILG